MKPTAFGQFGLNLFNQKSISTSEW